jgi:hypothetical protein
MVCELSMVHYVTALEPAGGLSGLWNFDASSVQEVCGSLTTSDRRTSAIGADWQTFDASYGIGFRDRVRAMNIEEVVTAPRSPWQNALAA